MVVDVRLDRLESNGAGGGRDPSHGLLMVWPRDA